MKIYARCAAQYIKARMEYRLDFVVSTIGMIVVNITTIFVFQILFTTIPSLAGWNFNEILFFYGFYLLSISPLQLFFDNIWGLRQSIVSGDFIKYYLRPMNIMFYFMSERVDIKGFSQLALGIGTLIYASIHLEIQWNLVRIALFGVALLGASLVAISIMVIAGSTGFWIMHGSLPVLNFTLKIRDFAPYPTTIFDGLFRIIFTYVIPIGFIAFYPSQLLLDPGSAPLLAILSPVIGIGIFFIAYRIWCRGVNTYTGTGS